MVLVVGGRVLYGPQGSGVQFRKVKERLLGNHSYGGQRVREGYDLINLISISLCRNILQRVVNQDLSKVSAKICQVWDS